MTFLSNILAKLGRQRIEEADRADSSPAGAGDADSTTGTGENETAVGRVAGQDEGYLETGAEKRAEAESDSEDGKPGG